jgi:hypothetical protein
MGIFDTYPLDFLTLLEGIDMFVSGKSGNPGGRPKGSYGGRIMALASLDRLLAKKKNQKALMNALERDLQADPVRFFRNVIMPLLPREARLSLDRDGVIQWRSLLGGTVEGSHLTVDGEGDPHPDPLPSQSEGEDCGTDGNGRIGQE